MSTLGIISGISTGSVTRVSGITSNTSITGIISMASRISSGGIVCISSLMHVMIKLVQLAVVALKVRFIWFVVLVL